MISYRLKELRTERNLSQEAVAHMMGACSASVVCRLEKGYFEPRIKTVVRIADAFDVSVDYLLGRDEDRGSRNAA
jgi:transcriptional regulator with XRE-family HTH domain